jgi:hypothetical protein
MCSATDPDVNLVRFFPTDVQFDGCPWMAKDGLPFIKNKTNIVIWEVLLSALSFLKLQCSWSAIVNSFEGQESAPDSCQLPQRSVNPAP